MWAVLSCTYLGIKIIICAVTERHNHSTMLAGGLGYPKNNTKSALAHCVSLFLQSGQRCLGCHQCHLLGLDRHLACPIWVWEILEARHRCGLRECPAGVQVDRHPHPVSRLLCSLAVQGVSICINVSAVRVVQLSTNVCLSAGRMYL